MLEKIKQYAKFIAAILTVIAASGAGLIPAEWAPWLQLAVAVIGAIAVYGVPNEVTDEQITRSKGLTLEQYQADEYFAQVRKEQDHASIDAQS